jgi:hypothetical protein
MVLVLTASTSFFSYPNRVGPFFGWQMLCDLEESRCLKFDDSFCELGPGAKGKYTIQFVLKLGSYFHSRTFCCSKTSCSRWPPDYHPSNKSGRARIKVGAGTSARETPTSCVPGFGNHFSVLGRKTLDSQRS